MNEEQRNAMSSRPGFIAALDQSGGSSPKALKLYGISEDEYDSDEKMFDLIHEMRERIMSSPSFSGDRILATILFEQTMDRAIDGQDTAAFLWEQKRVVPFVKVDQGLDAAEDWCAADEADDEARFPVGSGRRKRRLRHQDALIHPGAE